mmetsp:Transcript_8329/g.24721  ORF Transcript_8329/g.24721 Transcript_8329/m.24721 type:complete len:449 (-) Transcript_8329:125-1471(-)
MADRSVNLLVGSALLMACGGFLAGRTSRLWDATGGGGQTPSGDGVPSAHRDSSRLSSLFSGQPDGEWGLVATCSNPNVEPPTPHCTPLSGGTAGRVLVTGGAGFIGSHTALALLRQGYSVLVVDNLVNASPESIARVRRLAEVGPSQLQLVLIDLRDAAGIRRVLLSCGPFDAVIHFAGLKAVGESVARPLAYYENNVAGTVTLLQEMAAANMTRIIFSSSATVYGTSPPPLKEDAQTGQGITNPYGQTKYVIERILRDCVGGKVAASGRAWQAISLRYFNPIGADASGEIGEQPNGVPNNVMPYITQVAAKLRTHLTVFGQDYPTKDGTGERDYIHVSDLADGHVAALRYFDRMGSTPSSEHFNLGTGKATSVLSLVAAFRKACNCNVPIQHGARRPGDLAQLYADPSRANTLLRWKASRTIADACTDTWRFISQNPRGFTQCTVEH